MGLTGEQELPENLGVPCRSQWLSQGAARDTRAHGTRGCRWQCAPGERTAKDPLSSTAKGGSVKHRIFSLLAVCVVVVGVAFVSAVPAQAATMSARNLLFKLAVHAENGS